MVGVDNRKTLGYPLLIWSLTWLVNILVATIAPTNILSVFAMIWSCVSAIIFIYLFRHVESNEFVTNKAMMRLGCGCLVVYYVIKGISTAYQMTPFVWLEGVAILGSIYVIFCWVGIFLFFLNVKLKLAGALFLISGMAVSFTSSLPNLSFIGLISWSWFSFLMPILSLIYIIGFLISIPLCMVWIRKG